MSTLTTKRATKKVSAVQQHRFFVVPEPTPTPIRLYADGGMIGGNPSLQGGTWAWCQVNEAGERILTASGIITPEQCNRGITTNNVTELAALVYGLERLPFDFTGVVCSDSWVSLQRVFLGARLKNIPRWLVERLHALQKSGWLAQMSYELLDGHPSQKHLRTGAGKRGAPVSIHNVFCDGECKRQAQQWRAATREEKNEV